MSEPARDAYNVRILTRCRVGKMLLKPGWTLSMPADKLSVAAHLCRVKTARPADEATARDIELFELMRAAQ